MREIAQALDGKVIVVLGGSRGIGAEIGRLAATAGAVVIAHSRSTTGVDVRDPDAVGQALTQVVSQHGRVDAVILTAGQLVVGALAETPEAAILEAVATNFTAAAVVAKIAYPFLRASRGHLVLFTSSSYTRGRSSYALYSSSKAAVVNLTQALAEEWGGDGVKVNAINPERTDTPMRQQAFGSEPPGTLLDPVTVAGSALALLASTLTGAIVDVRLADPMVPTNVSGDTRIVDQR